jgi:hypothetical protein
MTDALHPLKTRDLLGVDQTGYIARLRRSMVGALRFAQVREENKRAKGRSFVAVTVTMEELMKNLRANDYRCALSGLEFYTDDGGSYGPTRPSIDRIMPKGDYSNENTRVVLLGVNALRGEGSDADMYRIAEALCRRRAEETQEVLGGGPRAREAPAWTRTNATRI